MLLDTNDWVDVYTEEGIEEGRKLKVFNHSTNTLMVKASANTPTDLTRTVTVLPNHGVIYHAGQGKLWIKKDSPSDSKITVTDGELPFSYSDNGLDPRVYTGYQGLTTQSFIEANVKNGTQFGITYEVQITAGSKAYAAIKTPTDTNVLIKTRLLSTDGGMRYMPRIGAVFTPDTTVIPSFNLNGQSANTSQLVANTVTAGNVTSLGTAFDVIRSASGTGSNREQGIFGTQGIERVLPKDTNILLEFENLDNKTIFVVYAVTWYEGPLSTELY